MVQPFFKRLDKWIGWLLLILFAAVAFNNISWGAPGIWHPDELAHRVISALNGTWEFDTVNFDYPSLPKYVMYGAGRIAESIGYSDHVLESLRFISVVIGGALVALTYELSRRIGSSQIFALLAGLLAFSCSELLKNASFAHNDIYLAFFVTLAAFPLIRYSENSERIWLYVSCLLIGLAASSKYNGASVFLVPLFLFLRTNSKNTLKDWLRTVETISISTGIFLFGYAIGTPRSVFWLASYAKGAIPAITRHGKYGWQPGARIGVIIQWKAMISGLGLPFFILSMLAILFSLVVIVNKLRRRNEGARTALTANKFVPILLLILLAYDIPILFSFNVASRFFTSMIPILAVLSASFIECVYRYLEEHQVLWGKYLITVCCIGALLYGGLRNAGVILYFANDQRIVATNYLKTLPQDTRIEYTLYPPNVNKEQFSSAHNYPIQFLKFADQELPTSPSYEFNIGEAGIEERKPDYLVIDSFTYDRFSNEYICQIHQADCDFFEKLLAGEANYELINVFEYDLPKFVPTSDLSFLNPDIRIYKRISP